VNTRGSMLRLRWTYGGKQRQLSLGLPDTPKGRRIAAETAEKIESDLISGEYDPTLAKYEPLRDLPDLGLDASTSTAELFDRFTEFKRLDGVSGQTIGTKYRALRSNIKRLGQDVSTAEDARQLMELLRDRQSSKIANQNLVLLKSFGKWLVEEKHLSTNIYEGIKPKKADGKRSQDRTPFSRDELSQFLATMLLHPTISHYYDFSIVLFSLGLRPSEAIGLRWQHVNTGRREITICESLSRAADGKSAGKARERKATKTGNVRILPLNDRLVRLFETRAQSGHEPDELIFSAADGGPIDDRNYRNRYWKPICNYAGIPYRPPYTSRHTLLSYGLEYGGWTERQAAFIAGHKSTRMISETYGHLINRPDLPDLG